MTEATPHVAASRQTSGSTSSYVTHSLVWTLQPVGEPSCVPRTRTCTPVPSHPARVLQPVTSPGAGRAAVADALADHESFAEEFGPVQVFRHPTTPQAQDARADPCPDRPTLFAPSRSDRCERARPISAGGRAVTITARRAGRAFGRPETPCPAVADAVCGTCLSSTAAGLEVPLGVTAVLPCRHVTPAAGPLGM